MLETFIANRQLKETLTEMIAGGRIPHGVLLEGEPGTGKKTLASLLIQAVLCTGENPPCGLCSGCQKTSRRVHPDWIEVGEDCQKPLSFHIDQIREIREKIQIAPNEGAKKVYLLHNAQNMTLSAQNALLKILEEPPAHAMFVLLCENRSSLLETILSRCAVFSLQAPSPQRCAAYLEEKFPETDPERLEEAAAAAGGNIGQALEILRQGETGVMARAREFLSHLVADDEFSFAVYLTQFERKRELFLSVLPLVKGLCEEMAIEKFTKNSNILLIKEASGKLSALQWMKIIDIIEDTVALLKQNGNLSLALTGFCVNSKMVVSR